MLHYTLLDLIGEYLPWNDAKHFLLINNYTEGDIQNYFKFRWIKRTIYRGTEIIKNHKNIMGTRTTQYYYTNINELLIRVKYGLMRTIYPAGSMTLNNIISMTDDEFFIDIDYELHGISWEFYPNKKLHIESNWKNHRLHGLYRVWDENGQLIEESMYIESDKQ